MSLSTRRDYGGSMGAMKIQTSEIRKRPNNQQIIHAFFYICFEFGYRSSPRFFFLDANCIDQLIVRQTIVPQYNFIWRSFTQMRVARNVLVFGCMCVFEFLFSFVSLVKSKEENRNMSIAATASTQRSSVETDTVLAESHTNLLFIRLMEVQHGVEIFRRVEQTVLCSSFNLKPSVFCLWLFTSVEVLFQVRTSKLDDPKYKSGTMHAIQTLVAAIVACTLPVKSMGSHCHTREKFRITTTATRSYRLF